MKLGLKIFSVTQSIKFNRSRMTLLSSFIPFRNYRPPGKSKFNASKGSSKSSNGGYDGIFESPQPQNRSFPEPETNFFSSRKAHTSYPINHQKKDADEIMLENMKTLMKPIEIKEYLDKYVIGQEHAKKVIAVAVYNHYCRVQVALQQRVATRKLIREVSRLNSDYFSEKKEISLEDVNVIVPEKSNIMLIGPSGSGKTLLAKTISKLLKVPFAMGDATGLTEAGYVGEDVDSLLYRLLEKAHFNESLAQMGIVFLDEIDKIACAGGRAKGAPNSGGSRDVGGEGVQHALLKMLEGTVVQVADRRSSGREFISFDTSNLLFILSGAFIGLENIVGSRSAHALSYMGFSDSESDKDSASTSLSPTILGNDCCSWMENLQTKDIISYGLIPEFVGRVPVMAVLEELSEDTLVRTLTEPKNSLVKQYQHLFKMSDVELTFSTEALQAISRIAVESRTGARGLRGIMEKLLLPLMYEIPSNNLISKVLIEKGFVEGNTPARVEYHK